MTNLISKGVMAYEYLVGDEHGQRFRASMTDRTRRELKRVTPDRCLDCENIVQDLTKMPNHLSAQTRIRLTVKCGLHTSSRCPKEVLSVENGTTWPAKWGATTAIQGHAVSGAWVDDYMDGVDIVPDPMSVLSAVKFDLKDPGSNEEGLEMITPDPAPKHYGSW